ncbi:XAC2610-related protein [Flavobacterium sharifuzzamanii]|uniref:XAC2610-related protein n=1 Tax=Flavobacterium sharifuzzamanii TaxID=2211133 RepID=UPI001300576D|nr:hypothetical protein [Flavobacterium sharifuzzamanii]KAF2079789.1 hypothetical protein DMA14_15255 [Flavobacterium sharifuzzamanii]
MKKSILLFLFIVMLFSCQHRTEIIKKRSEIAKDTVLRKELKVGTIADKYLDTTKTKKDKPEKIVSDEGEVILLPNNRYAVVILDYYENEKEEDPEKKWVVFPVKVKVYDRKTKKQLPEIKFDGYFGEEHDDNFDGTINYGDFNFDGKMDVAIRTGTPYYRYFYKWNFYLATSKGYKFSKSFSKIMDDAIAYLKLDAKNKRIFAYREADYYNCAEYKIKNNKAELIKVTSTSHNPSPFTGHSESIWNGKEMVMTKNYKTLYNDLKEVEKKSILSFDVNHKIKKILLFIDNSISETLCYAEVKNDSIVDFGASGIKVYYSTKENTLAFTVENKQFKIYQSVNKIDVEMTENGKTTKLSGDIKSKKGSLSNLNSKKWENESWYRYYVVIENKK